MKGSSWLNIQCLRFPASYPGILAFSVERAQEVLLVGGIRRPTANKSVDIKFHLHTGYFSPQIVLGADPRAPLSGEPFMEEVPNNH